MTEVLPLIVDAFDNVALPVLVLAAAGYFIQVGLDAVLGPVRRGR